MRERSGTGVPTARRSGRLRHLSASGGPRSSRRVRSRTQAFVRGRSVMKLGLAVVRAVIGLLMFGHGAQKLFGWFGGHGLHGTAGFFDQVGLKPGRRTALAAGAGEAGGGAPLPPRLPPPPPPAAVIRGLTPTVLAGDPPQGPGEPGGGRGDKPRA